MEDQRIVFLWSSLYKHSIYWSLMKVHLHLIAFTKAYFLRGISMDKSLRAKDAQG